MSTVLDIFIFLHILFVSFLTCIVCNRLFSNKLLDFIYLHRVLCTVSHDCRFILNMLHILRFIFVTYPIYSHLFITLFIYIIYFFLLRRFYCLIFADASILGVCCVILRFILEFLFIYFYIGGTHTHTPIK